jgi:hypothetical protein
VGLVISQQKSRSLETGRPACCFGKVTVADVGRVLGDLYEPIAQNRGMALNVNLPHDATAHSERGL